MRLARILVGSPRRFPNRLRISASIHHDNSLLSRAARLHHGLLAAAALAVYVPSAAAAAGDDPRYSIDDLLSRPIVSSLTAASSTPRIAWSENSRGKRSLWTAATPAFEPRLLTSFDRDDGQPLSDLQLSPSGHLLLFTRGSGPNAAGQTANPASDPLGAEQAVWAVPTDGGREPWRVVDGAGAVIMPSGKTAIYAREGTVFEVVLAPPAQPAADTRAEPADDGPAALFSARGGIDQLTPSPDGQRIAFVSNRGDHSFVGVFDRAPPHITWIEPGVDRDGNPTFSSDGTSIAFIRVPGARIGERFDITGATAFSVWTAEAETGHARKIWQAPDGAGGFAQFYPPQALAFTGADTFLVLTSEHSGFLHLHRLALWDGPDPDSLPADDGAIDLTPGDFEIEGFRISSDETTVYVWGNHGDRDRRHIGRLDIVDGRMRLVTGGRGIEVEPVPLVDGTLAYRSADPRRPMAITVAEGDGAKARIIAPSSLPESYPREALVTPEAVTFVAADGTEIHGQLFQPPGAGPDTSSPRRAAVIFLHGGPIRQMLLGWHYSGYYANAYAFNQFLASRGYVVLAVNYRAGIGYGRDFRRAPNQGPRGAAEYQDVVAAGRYLAARTDVDPGRIGLWGGSYGGLLTAMALARDSDLFAAGVDLHGVHDWSFRATDFPLPGGAWGLGEDDLEVAFESSPVAAVDGWRSPVLFVHGDDDRNVLFQQTTDLVRRLRDRGVPHEILVFPDEVHGFLRYASWLRTFETAYEFFERFLSSKP